MDCRLLLLQEEEEVTDEASGSDASAEEDKASGSDQGESGDKDEDYEVRNILRYMSLASFHLEEAR